MHLGQRCSLWVVFQHVPTMKHTIAATKGQFSQLGETAPRKFSKARTLGFRYGICAKTIFRLADRGLIDRYKLNARVVLFADDEVAALVESARIGGGTK